MKEEPEMQLQSLRGVHCTLHTYCCLSLVKLFLSRDWLPAKERMPLLEWWEVLKSEVKMAAKMVTKDKKNERKEELNFLMTLQAHLAAKVSAGDLQSLPDLHQAQERISN